MDYFFKEKPTQTWSSIIVPNSSLLPCCNHSILQCKPNNILINELQNPLAKKTFTVCSPQEAIVRIRLREQNDVTEPLVLSFSGATDWLKGWRETCRPITKRNKAKQISIQNEATHPGLFSVARAKINVHGTKENIEKDVFSSSHERGTKNSESPWGIEPQTSGSVVEHRSAGSEGLRFDSSQGSFFFVPRS